MRLLVLALALRDRSVSVGSDGKLEDAPMPHAPSMSEEDLEAGIQKRDPGILSTLKANHQDSVEFQSKWKAMKQRVEKEREAAAARDGDEDADGEGDEGSLLETGPDSDPAPTKSPAMSEEDLDAGIAKRDPGILPTLRQNHQDSKDYQNWWKGMKRSAEKERERSAATLSDEDLGDDASLLETGEADPTGLTQHFGHVEAGVADLKAELAANLAGFKRAAEEAARGAQPSSFAETPAVDAAFDALRTKIKAEMQDFKRQVDADLQASPPSSLLQTSGGKVGATLDALEARIRAQTMAFKQALPAEIQASLLEVDPEDAEDGPTAAEREAEADKQADADEAAADALGDEDGPETDAEKAETAQAEKDADQSMVSLTAALAKDKKEQQAMVAKIAGIGKQDAPTPDDIQKLSRQVAASAPAKPSSLAETHMRYEPHKMTWSDLPKSYRRFGDMVAAVDALAAPCREAGFTLTRTAVTGAAGSALPDQPVVLETVTLTPAAPTRKVAAFFGEHPRELISPETGLTMLEALCGINTPCVECQESHEATRANLKEAAATGAQTQWLVVLNSNPLTRQQIEESGDFCLRYDPEGVDTNRNYDDHWDESSGADAEAHGDRPFSAPEVAALEKVLADFRPSVFFSIHSGERGLYTPHAWSTQTDVTLPEAAALGKVPRKLIPDNYEIGSAGELQGRPITGSSFDYAKDKLGAKYSYAFELYKNDAIPPFSAKSCFEYFNPADADTYTEVSENFAAVILQTAAHSA